MLVLTNRNILSVKDKNYELGFGEQLSEKGPSEIRLAHATFNAKKWQVDIVPEVSLSKKTSPDLEDFPSYKEFIKLLTHCRSVNKHCLFYVHGYGKTFEETLEQGHRLEKKYNVEVVLFSWPSNTGGMAIKEYKNVKRHAISSSTALDNIFEKLSEYMKFKFDKEKLLGCNITINLMTYSMGNYVFQRYIEESMYDGETQIFTNIILCQADVNNHNHDYWVNKIQTGKRVYITINENDKILAWSDANFQKDRLGRTAKNLIAKNAIYLDFTDGKNVKNIHQVWYEVNENQIVDQFFEAVFTGMRGENTEGLIFDNNKNVYKL